MILAHLGTVEHRIKAGDLVDLHRCHFQNFGNFVHGGESQEVGVLFLSYEQEWDDCGVFVVGGAFMDADAPADVCPS